MDKMIHDPNVVESSTIGFINFKKSIGECKIEVFSLEGPVPHFHISNTDGSFNCCVQIYSAKYFSHGPYKDRLTNSQCKQLNSYLKTVSPYGTNNSTVWNVISTIWNTSNNNNKESLKLHSTSTQPDYSKINS